MNKDMILCITGESGSGKDTVAKHLIKKGYNIVETYTTRPKRYENENGHIFIEKNSSNEIFSMLMKDELKDLTYKDYFDNNWYWATKSLHGSSTKNVYCANPRGVESIKQFSLDSIVIVIYLKTSDDNRIQRMKKRMQINNIYVDNLDQMIEKRIEYEKHDYKKFACDYILDNNSSFEETINNLYYLVDIIESKYIK